jgi:hypothetical protein
MLFLTFVMKEQKRVASFSLTEAGYQALLSLEKKTKLSRKEVVSSALTKELKVAINQSVVTFRLPDPAEIMLLRTEIVNLESQSDDLIKALFGLRPKDKEHAKELAGLITELQNHIKRLRDIDAVFKQKQHLIKELSPADYKLIPKVIEGIENLLEAAKGKADAAGRIARHELTLRLLRIVCPPDEPEKEKEKT